MGEVRHFASPVRRRDSRRNPFSEENVRDGNVSHCWSGNSASLLRCERVSVPYHRVALLSLSMWAPYAAQKLPLGGSGDLRLLNPLELLAGGSS